MKQKIHAVGVIFENLKSEVLVLKRHKDSLEGDTWGLVGGKIDNGEDAANAACRETLEEIGIKITPASLIFLKTYTWERENTTIVFDTFKFKTTDNLVINLDINENTEYEWTVPSDLYQKRNLMEGLYPILKDEYKLS